MLLCIEYHLSWVTSLSSSTPCYLRRATQWDFSSRIRPYDFSIVVLHAISINVSTHGNECSEIVFEFECIAIGWLRVKLILVLTRSIGIPKWTSPSTNRYRTFLLKSPHHLQAMHWKLTEYERCCMQDNQLTTKSHVEWGEITLMLGEHIVLKFKLWHADRLVWR